MPAETERPKATSYAIEATAGAWKGQLDCEAFERVLYESRLASAR